MIILCPHAAVVESAYTADLKSAPKGYGFKSRQRHQRRSSLRTAQKPASAKAFAGFCVCAPGLLLPKAKLFSSFAFAFKVLFVVCTSAESFFLSETGVSRGTPVSVLLWMRGSLAPYLVTMNRDNRGGIICPPIRCCTEKDAVGRVAKRPPVGFCLWQEAGAEATRPTAFGFRLRIRRDTAIISDCSARIS